MSKVYRGNVIRSCFQLFAIMASDNISILQYFHHDREDSHSGLFGVCFHNAWNSTRLLPQCVNFYGTASVGISVVKVHTLWTQTLITMGPGDHMATEIWVNIGSNNGLLADVTKPLPEPILLIMTTDECLNPWHAFRHCIFKWLSHLPGDNELIHCRVMNAVCTLVMIVLQCRYDKLDGSAMIDTGCSHAIGRTAHMQKLM